MSLLYIFIYIYIYREREREREINAKDLRHQNNIENKNDKFEKLALCNFKTCSKVTVIKAMWYWYTVDKWNRIAS